MNKEDLIEAYQDYKFPVRDKINSRCFCIEQDLILRKRIDWQSIEGDGTFT